MLIRFNLQETELIHMQVASSFPKSKCPKLQKSVFSCALLQVAGIGRFPAHILVEIVRAPALAGTRNEEPVVVKSHLETSKGVNAVTMMRTCRCASFRLNACSLLQVLLVILECI